MALEQVLGYAAAACTTIAAIPQLVKAVRTKHTRDISLAYFLLLTLGVVLWESYGILTGDGPVIVANLLTLLVLLGVILAKLTYG